MRPTTHQVLFRGRSPAAGPGGNRTDRSRMRGVPRRSREQAPLAWLTLLLACLQLLAGTALAGEPQIRVRLDPAQVRVGGSVYLEVELEGFSGGAQPEIPKLDGIDVYESGRSNNISIINGKFSRSTTYSYQLLARREGSYSIGPITVRDDGRVHESEAVTLQVAGRAAAPATGGSGAPPPAAGEPVAPDKAAEGLFARVVVDQNEPFLDQQVTMRFQLFRRADVAVVGTRGFSPPVTAGFWQEDLGPERQYQVEIDGQTYLVTELAWALFPTRDGELEIGPSEVTCYVEARSNRRRRDPFSDFFDRDFFGRSLFDQRAVQLRTDPVRVRVRPLPEAGRPAGFSGSVGDYSIEASIDAPQGRQGEPLALTVTVRGSGHIQTIGPPIWPEWGDLRVFDSGDAVSLEKRGGRIYGEKQFTQVLVPSRAGDLQIPPVRFVYFDPQAERYRSLATEPLNLQVAAAAPGTLGATRGPQGHAEEMLYIRTELLGTLQRRRVSQVSAGWLVHLLPLALLGGAAGVRRRRLRHEADPDLARRAGAQRRALAGLHGLRERPEPEEAARRLADVLETYLGDWLGRAVRGLPRGEIAARLDEAGLDPELSRRVTALLGWTDEVRFAAGRSEETADRMAEARRLLHELEEGLRRTRLGRRV